MWQAQWKGMEEGMLHKEETEEMNNNSGHI